MLDSPVQHGSADPSVADFSVHVHPHRSQVVVAPSGEIDLATVAAIEREITDLREAGFDDIVLDLRAVTFIDSSGLHLLLTQTRNAARDGYRFRLVGASPAAQRLFDLTGTGEAFAFVDRGGL